MFQSLVRAVPRVRVLVVRNPNSGVTEAADKMMHMKDA